MKYYTMISGTFGDTTKVRFAAHSAHRTEKAANKVAAKIGAHVRVIHAHGDEPCGMYRAVGAI